MGDSTRRDPVSEQVKCSRQMQAQHPGSGGGERLPLLSDALSPARLFMAADGVEPIVERMQ
jgi:hypothetical protein